MFQLFPTKPLVKTLNQFKGGSKENQRQGKRRWLMPEMADVRDCRRHFPLFLGMIIKVSVLSTSLLYTALYLQCATFNPQGDK